MAGLGAALLATKAGVQRCSGLTPQRLLQQHPHGVYTAARITPQLEIVDWELHRARLVRSIRVVNDARGSFAAVLALAHGQAASLEELVGYQLQAGLHWSWPHLQSMFNAQSADADGAGSGSSRASQIMLVALLTSPVDDTTESAGATSSSSSSLELLDVTMLWLQQRSAPLKAAQVLVHGPGREAAGAKHARWVQQRQPLHEAMCAAGADEALLCSDDGQLLEGLTTNFYVVTDVEGAPGAVELHTASDGVGALRGVAQVRVVEAASAFGLKVRREAPRLEQRAAWREAFLSNCLKGIQPVSRVFSSTPGEEWEVRLPEAPGRYTVQLQAALPTVQVCTPIQDLV